MNRALSHGPREGLWIGPSHMAPGKVYGSDPLTWPQGRFIDRALTWPQEWFMDRALTGRQGRFMDVRIKKIYFQNPRKKEAK